MDDINDRELLLSLNLLEIKDEKKYLKKLYSISNNIFKNYKIYKIKNKNGKIRTVYEPNYYLKQIQRSILKNILEKKEISKNARAYIKGISLRDNAKEHANKKIILKLDIEDFFNNISFLTVYTNCFPKKEYSKSIGYLLTTLCTYGDFVPQGSPTGAYISNVVMKNFDEEINEYCLKNNISYTRYSDDMTFSGDFNVQKVIELVKKLLKQNGFTLNKNKIRVITRKNAQKVTGIIVNEKIQVERKYRNKIRQEIYYIKKFGLGSHLEKLNIKDSKKYLSGLLGKINFCLQINKDDEKLKEYRKIAKGIINSDYNN